MAGIVKSPNKEDKLDILAESARYDVCLASCSGNLRGGVGRVKDPLDPINRWIYPAVIPGKGRVGILKVLMTNACKNNCSYCTLSSDKDSVRRVGFAPYELASIFMEFVRKKLVHGIFLSSGVGSNVDAVMDRMIRTAEILRKTHKFSGYIHLKILPGASFNLIEEATRFSDRISMNLEAPTREHLGVIAPEKDFVKDLMLRMKWAGDLIQKKPYTKSHTTQFVVGASDETDLDILKTVDWVYRKLYIFRAYFSAFQPGAQQGHLHSYPLLREHRLYQSDFLLRGYGFRFHDLVFNENGELPRHIDPKTAYAKIHPELYPVDINRAPEKDLLKVPGIGPVSARRIVETRRSESFHNLEELKRIRAVVKWAAPYVEFSGKRDSLYEDNCLQKRLFDETSSSGWQTGLEPYQKEQLTASKAPVSSYDYPGQKGKRLSFTTSKNAVPLTCR